LNGDKARHEGDLPLTGPTLKRRPLIIGVGMGTDKGYNYGEFGRERVNYD